MEETIKEEVHEFCKYLEEFNEAPKDMRFEFQIAVLNSLWKMISNHRYDYTDPRLMKVLKLMDIMFSEGSEPLMHLSYFYRPVAFLCQKLGIMQSWVCNVEMVKVCRETILEHVQTYQEDNMRDFIDLTLRRMNIEESKSAGGIRSFKGIEGQVNLVNDLVDLLIAGSETTSTTLNWAMLYMVMNPEVQENVRKELDEITGRSRALTWEDRERTPYTEAVIHEIQRMANILDLSVVHRATQDCRVGKYFIPKDTQIFFNIGRAMQDPKEFPEPKKFDPTRYLTKDGKFEPHPKIIPFGSGKRRCLGETLARASLYLFFGGIISNFDVIKGHQSDVLTDEANFGSTRSPLPFKVRFLHRK